MAAKKNKKKPSSIYPGAYAFAKTWVSKQFKSFTSEDLLDAYELTDPKFDDNRALGNVMLQLAKGGFILKHGFTTYKKKSGHSRICTLWISKEYSEKQSNNRRDKNAPPTYIEPTLPFDGD